mgnify:CR=1 FL=1
MKKFSIFNLHLSILILFFSFFATVSLAAKNVPGDTGGNPSPNEEKARAYLRELTFEITRYCMTGFSSLPESAAFANISQLGARLLSLHKIVDSAKRPVYLCEYYNPEKVGVIDATFCPDDLYVASDFTASDDESEGEGETAPQFDWVDIVLQTLNAPSSTRSTLSEPVGILDGEKILEMLEHNDGRGIDSQDEKKSADDAPKEFSYTKKDGELRRFAYDGEHFSLSTEGDDTIVVNYYGDKLIRKRFDSFYRLVKTEQFKTAATARNMSLETQTDYTYAGETNLLKSSIEDLFSTKKHREQRFDENGRSIYLLESHYEERENKKAKKKDAGTTEKETVRLDDRKTTKAYDARGRMTEEEICTWSYKTNSFGRNLVEERVVKNVYTYHENASLPADLAFYENGELHLERKYTTASDYSEKLYFDGGFSVELVYEGGLKKTEIIYLNDVEQRRRTFDY